MYVRLVLRFFAEQVAQSRHYCCSVGQETLGTAERVDAQASDTRTGIGGWVPRFSPDGRLYVKTSPWFLTGTRTMCFVDFPCFSFGFVRELEEESGETREEGRGEVRGGKTQWSR